MALAIFDLDETLIGIDSDHAWGEYITEKELVNSDTFSARNAQFYADYKRGELNADEYYAFSCEILAQHPIELLVEHRADFVETVIKPNLLQKAQELVHRERAEGRTLIVVTATMEFITEPIVALFGINELIAPIPEQVNGAYTGKLQGEPSFGPGKVTRLKAWLETTNHNLTDSRFYSDSHNDLPLLELVDEPIAVDPDEKLAAIAAEKGWACISLR